MPAKTHHVRLSVEERASLEKVSRSNHRSEREKKRARMLLLCDANTPKEQGGSHTDAQVAQVLKCSPNTVYQLRHRVPDRGAMEVVTRAEQGHRKARKLDGVGEAQKLRLLSGVSLSKIANNFNFKLSCLQVSTMQVYPLKSSQEVSNKAQRRRF